jgi:hypothetical protein
MSGDDSSCLDLWQAVRLVMFDGTSEEDEFVWIKRLEDEEVRRTELGARGLAHRASLRREHALEDALSYLKELARKGQIIVRGSRQGAALEDIPSSYWAAADFEPLDDNGRGAAFKVAEKGDPWTTGRVPILATHTRDYAANYWTNLCFKRPEIEAALSKDARRSQESNRRPRPASLSALNVAISAVYDAAQANGAKPPNVRELPAAVRAILERQGLTASGKQIQACASEEPHRSRRRPPGRTLASERRRQQQ